MDFRTAKFLAEQKAKTVVQSVKIFEKDTKAEMNLIKLVIGVFLAAILVGALVPTGLNAVVSSRNGSWSSSLLATYDAIPILVAVAVLAIFAGLAYKAFSD